MKLEKENSISQTQHSVGSFAGRMYHVEVRGSGLKDETEVLGHVIKENNHFLMRKLNTEDLFGSNGN